MADEMTFDFEVASDGKVTAPAIAAALNMNAKSVRRRIRAMTDDRAGRGGEWRFDVDAANEIARRILTTNGRKVTEFTFKD